MDGIHVYEMDGGGHRFWYVRLLYEEAAAAGETLTLHTNRQAHQRQEYRRHLADSSIRVRMVRTPHGTSRMWAAIVHAFRVSLLSRRCSLVVLDADRLLVPLSLLPRWLSGKRLTLLVLRPHSQGRLGGLKRAAARRMRRRAHVLALGDQFVDSSAVDELSGLQWISDPGPLVRVGRSVTVASSMVGRPTLLVAGVLDQRKCLTEILDALPMADFNLRLVGRVSSDCIESVHKAIQLHPDRVTLINEYVTDEILDSEIQRAHFVSCILRSDSGSSGILGRSIAASVPVIGGGNATVRETVAKKGFGVVIPGLDSGSIAWAVERGLETYDVLKAAATLWSKRVATPRDFYSSLTTWR